MADGFAPKSINNQLAVLGRMLHVAVEWNVIGAAPNIKPLRCPKEELDFLDFAEAKRLVEATAPEWRPMVVTALNTGLRQGELLALRWGGRGPEGGTPDRQAQRLEGVVGTPKSGRSREVPLNETALDALRGQRHLRGPLVFCNQDGSRLAFTQCYWPLVVACRRAGLRRVQWHALRHTFASHLVMRGVPLKAVATLLATAQRP